MLEKLFNECKEIIIDRGQDYGDAKESFKRIASYWGVYLGRELTAKDVAMMMTLMKISREQSGKKRDNIIDGINYLALTEVLNEEVLP